MSRTDIHTDHSSVAHTRVADSSSSHLSSSSSSSSSSSFSSSSHSLPCASSPSSRPPPHAMVDSSLLYASLSFAELRRRLDADGYIFVKGVIPTAAAQTVRTSIIRKLDEEGMINKGGRENSDQATIATKVVPKSATKAMRLDIPACRGWSISTDGKSSGLSSLLNPPWFDTQSATPRPLSHVVASSSSSSSSSSALSAAAASLPFSAHRGQWPDDATKSSITDVVNGAALRTFCERLFGSDERLGVARTDASGTAEREGQADRGDVNAARQHTSTPMVTIDAYGMNMLCEATSSSSSSPSPFVFVHGQDMVRVMGTNDSTVEHADYYYFKHHQFKLSGDTSLPPSTHHSSPISSSSSSSSSSPSPLFSSSHGDTIVPHTTLIVANTNNDDRRRSVTIPRTSVAQCGTCATVDTGRRFTCSMCGRQFNSCVPFPPRPCADIGSRVESESDVVYAGSSSPSWHCAGCANLPLPYWTCWISLSDVAATEGRPMVIPASHRLQGYEERQWQRRREKGTVPSPKQIDNDRRKDAALGDKLLPSEYTAEYAASAVWHAPSSIAIGDIIMYNVKAIHAETRNEGDNYGLSIDTKVTTNVTVGSASRYCAGVRSLDSDHRMMPYVSHSGDNAMKATTAAPPIYVSYKSASARMREQREKAARR